MSEINIVIEPLISKQPIEIQMTVPGAQGIPGDFTLLIDDTQALPDKTYSSDKIETELSSKVDDSQVLTNVPSGALFTDDQTASEVPISDTGTLYDATNVETALAEVMGDLNTHKAESMSQMINNTRDVSLIGTQRIATVKKPKMIIATGNVAGTKKMSIGTVNRCLYQFGDTGNYASGGFAVIIADTGANRTFGLINNVTNTGFDIVWSHGGTGATGTAELIFTIMYHGV